MSSSRSSVDSGGETVSVGSSPRTPPSFSEDGSNAFAPLSGFLLPSPSPGELESSRMSRLLHQESDVVVARLALCEVRRNTIPEKPNMSGGRGAVPRDGSDGSQLASPPSDRPPASSTGDVGPPSHRTAGFSTRNFQFASSELGVSLSVAFPPADPSLIAPRGSHSLADSNVTCGTAPPSESSLPSLITDRTDNTRSTSFSVTTSLKSAVSGVPPFDPSTSGAHEHVPNLGYECWANIALNCEEESFEDIDEWCTHCVSHFHPYGPPLQGSQCPFCGFRAGPELIPGDVMVQPLDDASKEKIRIKAKNSRTKPYRQDRSWRTQADYLWARRQAHVAKHYEGGWSNAAATPDFEMYRYLRNNHLISDAHYKELQGPRRSLRDEDDGAYTSNVDSRRER